MLIGLIADTHGYVDPRLQAAFQGVDLILHAGDIGKATVLEELQRLAPTRAVLGNNDADLTHLDLEEHLYLELAGRRLQVVHQWPQATSPEQYDVVIAGHSHKAIIEQRDSTLFVNPGAAGRRGFHRLQTVALLVLEPRTAPRAEIVPLGERLRS